MYLSKSAYGNTFILLVFSVWYLKEQQFSNNIFFPVPHYCVKVKDVFEVLLRSQSDFFLLLANLTANKLNLESKGKKFFWANFFWQDKNAKIMFQFVKKQLHVRRRFYLFVIVLLSFTKNKPFFTFQKSFFFSPSVSNFCTFCYPLWIIIQLLCQIIENILSL